MAMARKKIPTNLALDPDVLAGVEAWIKRQEFPVTKTWVFEQALGEWLAKRQADEAEEPATDEHQKDT